MRRLIDLVDSLITAPVESPLTVAYAKRHLRLLADAEDDLVASWILAAGSYFEEQTGRQLITATRELWLDRFPCQYENVYSDSAGYVTGQRIELPHPPLQSVVSVQYIDGTGVLQPFSDGASPETLSYHVKAPAGPYAARGWVEPIYGLTWPITREESGAVRIRYLAGYGDTPDQIPDLVRAILCFLVAHFDQHRVAVTEKPLTALPFGVQMMLDGFKYSGYPGVALR